MKTLSSELDIHTLDAAAALLLLRHRFPPDLHPRPSDLAASSSIPFEKTIPFFFPPWGIRSRRSSSTCGCRSKQELEEDDCSRPSPATPLDYAGTSFDPSTSGSEGFHTSPEIATTKRLLAGDVSAPLSVVPSKVGALVVEAVVTTTKTIRRRGKKKTISELQAQERSLTEEKSLLVKMLETTRKDMEILKAENRMLKTEAASLQMQMLPKALKPAFFLPDLNEPVPMEANCPDM